MFVLYLLQLILPVIKSGRASNVYMIYMKNLLHITHGYTWFDDNPFDPNTKSHKSLMNVRKRHLFSSKLMNDKYRRKENKLWFSQMDMILLQWAGIGLIG